MIEFQVYIFCVIFQYCFFDMFKGCVSVFYGDYDKMYQNFYVFGYDQVVLLNVVILDGYFDMIQCQNFILFGDLIGEFQMGGLCYIVVVGVEYIDIVNNNDCYNMFFDQIVDDNESFIIQCLLDI